MEWYKDKPILYGLGHFVFDFRLGMSAAELEKFLQEVSSGDYWNAPYVVGPREGWPLLPMHEDTRMTMFAWATANAKGVNRIGFLPCRLTPDGSVRPLPLDSADAREIVQYFERCNTSQRLNTVAIPSPAMTLAGFQTLEVIPKPSSKMPLPG